MLEGAATAPPERAPGPGPAQATAGAGAAGRTARTLEPLETREQRAGRGIDLGRGRLDQHELELDPCLGAVGGRLERPGDQVEQPDGVGAR